MRKRIRKLGVVVLLISFPLLLNAQNNTNSPYSRYGIGELFRKPFGTYRGLGGTSIGMRIPNSINFLNPAAYSSQDTLSFIFDFGLRYSNTNYKSTELEAGIDNLNIDHLAISFPITKWWYGSAGLLPYSNVGYKIIQYVDVPVNNLDANTFYEGTGGLTQFYFGSSFKVIENFSMGFNLSYLFGPIDHNRSTIFIQNGVQDSSFTYSEETKRMTIRDIMLNFGAQYTYTHNKNSYTLGIIYDNQTKLSAHEDIMLITRLPGIYYYVGDSIRVPVTDTSSFLEGENQNIVFPASFGIGLCYNHDNKLILGLDYSMQEWSKYKSLSKKDSLQNSHLISFGIQYTPNRKSITSYFERIDYRAGFRYHISPFKFDNTTITDFGLSFGLGLPLSNRKTKLNISYEYGQRGTLSNGLIQEDYHIVSLSLSLYDNWFYKTKFD